MVKMFGALLITACISMATSGCVGQDQTLQQRERMERIALEKYQAALARPRAAAVDKTSATTSAVTAEQTGAATAHPGKVYDSDCQASCVQGTADPDSADCYDYGGNYVHLEYQLDPNTGLMYSNPSFCELCNGTACNDNGGGDDGDPLEF